MVKLAGPSASVQFTHLSQNAGNSLRTKLSSFGGVQGKDQHARYEVHTASILDLLQEKGVPLEKVCLLDPKAERVLEPGDKNEFGWFLFGVCLIISFSRISPSHITAYREYSVSAHWLLNMSDDSVASMAQVMTLRAIVLRSSASLVSHRDTWVLCR